MIAKVVRGYRPAGLVVYLFGPGRFEEHRDPRVVGSWDGAPWLHQPDRLLSVALDGEVLPAGEFDFDLRPLIETMRAPLRLAGLPVSGLPALPALWAERLRAGAADTSAPAWLRHYRFDARRQAVVARPGPVWHCSVRLHPDDPVLTDGQWERIAQRLMRATGIDQAGCRWIAVRHADDHVHLVATLVSAETGKRVHPYRDFLKLRQACQGLEREFGLVPTASADGTAAPAPTRAERAKAARLGRGLTAREELRRNVARCAATSRDGVEFMAALAKEGLDPHAKLDANGQVLGYTVARRYDRAADGSPVRYSGSKLAPDLSWPRLTARWADVPRSTAAAPAGTAGRRPDKRRDVLQDCARVAERAAQQVRTGQDVEGVAHAAGEVLTALSGGSEGSVTGPLSTLADRYDRAARSPHGVMPAGAVARELRHAARRLGAIGILTGRGSEALATAALLVALAGLVAEIAAWQQLHRRSHQAAAARATAQALPGLARITRPRQPETARTTAPVNQSRPRPHPGHSPKPGSPGRGR